MQNKTDKTYIMHATAIQQMYQNADDHGPTGNAYLFIFTRYYQ